MRSLHSLKVIVLVLESFGRRVPIFFAKKNEFQNRGAAIVLLMYCGYTLLRINGA
jgi:hypothetical protein